MSSKFCDNCFSLLEKQTTPTSFLLYCRGCSKHHTPSINDYVVNKMSAVRSSDTIHPAVFINAGKDPTNIRIKKNCTKCDSKYARTVRTGSTLTLYKICTKCDNIM